jgi:hypothetical protein
MIEPDDALNAIGRVEAQGDAFVVVVEDPGAVVLAGDPVAAGGRPLAGPAGAAQASGETGQGATTGTSRFAGFGGAQWPVEPGAAGVGTLLAISALSLAVTLLRRSRSRRRLAARIASRLASFAAPTPARRDPIAAEREPSTNHAA